MFDIMAHERHQILSQPAHVKSADGDECNFLGRHRVSFFFVFLRFFSSLFGSAGLQQHEQIR